MIRRFIPYIIILTAIFLLAIASSALAYNAEDISNNIEYNEQTGAFEYQLQLLFQLIDKYNPTLNLEQKKLVCRTILMESQTTGFDPFFISSIIAAESSFHPKAVSPCKALGLMQLTSCVYRPMHIRDPFNIEENIYAGTRFLQYLKTQFNDSNLILAAYNAGPTRVARLGRIPRIRETIAYIKKVNSLYFNLRQDFVALLNNSINKIQLCKTIKALTNSKQGVQFASYSRSSTPTTCLANLHYICEPDQSSRFFLKA
jgi:soluble lytic murein transglycosylase-like protein